MNRCKQCGKEIPDYKQFCNRSCANRYNNLHRVRRPWTEEQRDRFSQKQKQKYDSEREKQGKETWYTESGELKQRKCKYCGTPLESATQKCCDVCRPYVSHLKTFEKLSVEGKSLQDKFNNLVQKIYNLYIVEKKSIIGIGVELGMWRQQVEILLVKGGIPRRSLSEGQRVALESGRVPLRKPHSQYKHGFHTTWQGTEIYYRSSWELEYAQQLDEQRVPYEVESKRIRYYDTVGRRERIAVPDFYLPETNELVEIKSHFTYNEQNMKDKFKAYRDSGYKPILFLDKKEMAL